MAQSPVKALFPTLVYVKKVCQKGTPWLKELKQDCLQIFQKDEKGHRWSQQQYPGGFTTFGSLDQLHRMTDTFRSFSRRLESHLKAYLKALGFGITSDQLYLSRMWLNVNPQGGYHGWHVHPLSVISGVFYVDVPNPGTGPLILHDPRWPSFMNRPPDPSGNRFLIQPETGLLVLFESFVPHQVWPHGHRKPRISVAFNWDWKG